MKVIKVKRVSCGCEEYPFCKHAPNATPKSEQPVAFDCPTCGRHYEEEVAEIKQRQATTGHCCDLCAQDNQPDALVSGSGTIYQITPLTPAAREWIDENVQAEGYMWLGSSLCVEHRYIADIVAGMIAAGLRVK